MKYNIYVFSNNIIDWTNAENAKINKYYHNAVKSSSFIHYNNIIEYANYAGMPSDIYFAVIGL